MIIQHTHTHTLTRARTHTHFVRNAAAFAARYPDGAIAGEYSGSLNNGGERILLVDRDDVPIVDLRFGDDMGFAGEPEADADSDGLSALLEYALNTSDEDPRSGPDAISLGVSGDAVVLQFSVRAEAPDITVEVEVSSDLSDWDSEAVLALEDSTTDGVQFRRFQIPNGFRYARLKVTLD